VISGGYANGNPQSLAIDTSQPSFSDTSSWYLKATRVGQIGDYVYPSIVCLNN
jgi:hypothetical protein